MDTINLLVSTTSPIINIPVTFTYKFLQPVTITWNPQPDITVYELARLLPVLFMHTGIMPDDIPKEPELLRHLEIYDPNQSK